MNQTTLRGYPIDADLRRAYRARRRRLTITAVLQHLRPRLQREVPNRYHRTDVQARSLQRRKPTPENGE